MSRTFALDDEDFADLLAGMEAYGAGAADVVSEVVHASGPDIRAEVDARMPQSGRTFKGHRSGARGSAWQRYDTGERMAITVGTTASRRYLYFPDDGSNTRRHAGMQNFFGEGAEAAAPQIMERAMDALISTFERG